MIATRERVFGDFTVRIDRTLCVGFADCINEAPEAFELDAEDIAVLVPLARVDGERLRRACAACPVDAISVVDHRRRAPGRGSDAPRSANRPCPEE